MNADMRRSRRADPTEPRRFRGLRPIDSRPPRDSGGLPGTAVLPGTNAQPGMNAPPGTSTSAPPGSNAHPDANARDQLRLSRADLILASALTAVMMVAALIGGPADALFRIGGAIISAGLMALAVRRRRPLAAALAVAVVILIEVTAAPGGAGGPGFLALMLAAYSLGRHADRPARFGGLALLAACVAVAQLVSPQAGYSHASAITFLTGILVVAPAAVGGIARTRAKLADRLRRDTEAMRADATVRLATQRDAHRNGIRAEIEQVILGGLESMREYADVRDRADVESVRDRGRDVLGRLRGLLGGLRDADTAGELPREPGDGLAALRTQVDRVLAAGAATPPPRARWTLLTPGRIDAVLAVAAGVYGLVIVSYQRNWLDVALGFASVLPLAATRRRPLRMAAIGLTATVLLALLTHLPDPLDGLLPVVFMIAFPLVLGAAAELVPAVVGLAMCLVAALVAAIGAPGAPPWGELLSSVPLVAGSWAAGRVLRAGVAALEADAAAGAREDARQRLAIREAVDADRARVARDLHDAVGHAMTAIVLQATAAVRVWDSEPDLARGHVEALRRTLAETLSELRPLVASVVMDAGSEPPGLDAVPGLVDRARRSGIRLDVVTGGSDPRGVDGPVDAIAYRIVQEALTNAYRHAPGATVTLRVERTAEGVSVDVGNDAPPYQVSSLGLNSGHGLRGMAERVAECGGTLDAGPTSDGGFRVRATLPVPA